MKVKKGETELCSNVKMILIYHRIPSLIRCMSNEQDNKDKIA